MSSPRIEVAQIVTRCIAGAGGVAFRGALHLDPERYRVTIVTGEGGPLTDRAQEAGMRVVIEPFLVSPIAPRRDAMALSRLTDICRRDAFDVVHTHSAKAGALGRIAARRAGVPVVVHTYHGFPFHDFQDPVRHAAYVTIERRLARITDHVLAIGTGVAAEALRRGLARPTNLRTVPPVVESEVVLRDPFSRSAARALLGLPDDLPVVGAVARADYQKAPEHLLAALARMRTPDVLVAWVGDGPLLEPLRKRASDLGLGDRFLMLGERSDVAQILPAFDVFALPSRYEGLPCAIVEAMRCGLPVVATSVNSVPDLVVPGVSGVLVPPGRPDAMAEALDGVLADPALADRLSRGGRELAGESYDAQRLSDVLDDVYRSGLSARSLAMAG
ncbi:MAG TPA: glycosyltransferase family 4 protein [Nocardioides sp.]|uniref:glycosyltransferase family 4 protein n=1 Tax=Nocardioides sp. TaxID=35761 RepID=UPI002F3E4D1E